MAFFDNRSPVLAVLRSRAEQRRQLRQGWGGDGGTFGQARWWLPVVDQQGFPVAEPLAVLMPLVFLAARIK